MKFSLGKLLYFFIKIHICVNFDKSHGNGKFERYENCKGKNSEQMWLWGNNFAAKLCESQRAIFGELRLVFADYR